eukprot:jgi/Mesvir1/6727/Mv12097-RA.2
MSSFGAKFTLFAALCLLLLTRNVADVGQSSSRQLSSRSEKNNRPVIGILALPVAVPAQRIYGYCSIATSYVRWVEAGGARVVPIVHDVSSDELTYLLPRLNGVLWTGEQNDYNGTAKDDPEGAKYLATTASILEFALESNDQGDFFPLWATGLGFQRLVQLLAKDTHNVLLTRIDAENYDMPLDLTGLAWGSRLFQSLDPGLLVQIADPKSHTSFNNLNIGVDPAKFAASSAAKSLKALSTANDRKGRAFLSTVEGHGIPLYGTQWHPEKAPWEWNTGLDIHHTDLQARFSAGHFEKAEAEDTILISNWQPRTTGGKSNITSPYSSIYFFKRGDNMYIHESAREDGFPIHDGKVGMAGRLSGSTIHVD